jgi:hypothetical protein
VAVSCLLPEVADPLRVGVPAYPAQGRAVSSAEAQRSAGEGTRVAGQRADAQPAPVAAEAVVKPSSISTYTDPSGQQRITRLWPDGSRDDRARAVTCPACGVTHTGWKRADDVCASCERAGCVAVPLPFEPAREAR